MGNILTYCAETADDDNSKHPITRKVSIKY